MKRKSTVVIGIVCFVCSLAFCLYNLGGGSQMAEGDMPGEDGELAPIERISPLEIGKFCISQTYHAVEWETDNGNLTADSENKEQKKKTIRKEKVEVDNSKPQVIIYHTHSSESYQPYSESNFHREAEEGTVREVGDVMAAELNAMGIAVVHDKTVHDRPSYNQSYSRSLETITTLQRQYPTAEVIIDLHRDAAAYTGNTAETISVNGETAAKYKLVVGQDNPNYSKLMAFAGAVNSQAESLYPGFSGRVIEKEYQYNEYIADRYLLLEVGNNQNDIEHAKTTGKYFAHVLAKILEGE